LAVGTTVDVSVPVGEKEGMTAGTSVGLELGFEKVQLPKSPVGESDGT
jgi:hypothetical protein